jgi:hypothetical protein
MARPKTIKDVQKPFELQDALPTPSTPVVDTPKVADFKANEAAKPTSQPKNKFPENTPQIIKDKSGKITGVALPNGTVVRDISPSQVSKLVFDFNKKITPPVGSAVAGSKEAIPLTREQQIQQQIDDENLKKQLIAQQTPPNLSPEQVAQIGQIPQNTGIDPLTADIQRLAFAHSNPLGKVAQDFQNTLAGDTNSPFRLPYVNKAVAFASALPYGTSIVNALSQDRATREYLQDYSQADNLGRIRSNIGTANTQIIDAINMAKFSENTPDKNKIAINIYNDALAKKRESIAQLKLIAQSDQRAYTDSIINDLTELERYFNEGGQAADDAEFYAALNKPTLKYLPQGGSNGRG